MPPTIPNRSSSDHSFSASRNVSDQSCPFCHIAHIYPPYNPLSPPPSSRNSNNNKHNNNHPLSPTLSAPNPATFLLLSTHYCIAFLDIMPLSTGHLLLCPRAHRRTLADVSRPESASLGHWLRVLSAAVGRATGVPDWNVVQNNGAAAAQVVPHAHFHVIPRPGLRGKGSERFTSTMFGRGRREDLDDGEARGLAERIRWEVRGVLLEEGQEEEEEGEELEEQEEAQQEDRKARL